MSFDALLLTKADDDSAPEAAVTELGEESLPEGNVVVAVEYSTVNYKDGLCLSPNGGGLVRNYPHVGGIDFAGTVESSDDDRYSPGDQVILTGWRVGEVHWGGYAQKARVNADWLVPLPAAMSTRQAMLIGTAIIYAFGLVGMSLNFLADKGAAGLRGRVWEIAPHASTTIPKEHPAEADPTLQPRS